MIPGGRPLLGWGVVLHVPAVAVAPRDAASDALAAMSAVEYCGGPGVCSSLTSTTSASVKSRGSSVSGSLSISSRASCVAQFERPRKFPSS
jgi:hypothetical protein